MIIGVDLGTTRIKSAIFDENGRILGLSYRDVPLITHSSDEIEQNPDDWIIAVKETIRESIKISKVKNIEALSFSSQGISFVCVDEKGKNLGNAISWLDTRAKKEAEEIKEKIEEKNIFKITGKRINPAYVLPKILWIKKNDKTRFMHTKKFLMCLDYLNFRFTGNFMTDHTMASGTLMYDIRKMAWSDKILRTFDIPYNKLPSISFSSTFIGYIKDEAAKELGLGRVKVYLGAQDQKCSCFSVGIDENTCVISLGTAVAISFLSNSPVIDKYMRIPCFPFVKKNTWILEGVISSGCASFDWLLKVLKEKPTILEKVNFKNSNLYFFPHLAGSTSPHWIPEARGIMYGINLDTRKEDIISSLIKGITFEIKENFEIISKLTKNRPKQTVVIGGGANSNNWLQLISDVLKTKVISFYRIESACLGASMFCKKIKPKIRSCVFLPKDDFTPEYNEYLRYENKFYTF
ncbi:MAG: hypothetical protein J7L39_01815 [Candidatus Aenigmarchaeota archaeon]|nr:hypothetical protein [Candidatus Aenigmarchaeota archaeon]